MTHTFRRLPILFDVLQYPGSVWRAQVRVGSGCQGPGKGCLEKGLCGGKCVFLLGLSVCGFYALYTTSSTTAVVVIRAWFIRTNTNV